MNFESKFGDCVLKSLMIFIYVIISIGCSTTIPRDTSYLVDDEFNQELNKKPNTRTATGTTPKMVVYEEGPIPIKKIRPEYPEHIRNAGIEGQVIVRAEIFKDGSVGSVEILQSLDPSPGGLDECAINAVKHWKFIPAKMQNEPIAVWVSFPIWFIQ